MITLLRPWWGLNVNGDMAGDFGSTDESDQVLPDCTLIYAASVLADAGCPVTVIDNNAEQMEPERLRRKVAELHPEKVFVKVAAATCTKDLELAESLGQAAGGPEVLVFGACLLSLAEEVLDRYRVNGVVMGDPNRVMRDLLQGHDDGIWTREHESKATYETLTLETLDDLPAARYDLTPFKRYRRGDVSPFAFVMTSLGCPHSCPHCPYVSVYGTSWRAKSAPRVVEELASLCRWGIRYVQFRDMTFTFSERRVVEICDGVMAEGVDVRWACETRVDQLSEDLVETMARAGCYQIQFGVESGSPTILKQIGRESCSAEKARQAIGWMRKYNIEPYAFFMIGFPGETQQTIQATIDLALTLDCDCRCSPLYIYPNSRWGRALLDKRKLTLDDLEKYDYVRAGSTICGLTEHELGAAKLRFDQTIRSNGLSLVPRDPAPIRR